MTQRRLAEFEGIEYKKPLSCSECGGSLKYTGLGEYVCEKCEHVMYDDYGKIRNYLEHHAGANIATLVTETGVSKSVIKRMLEDDRFTLINHGISE